MPTQVSVTSVPVSPRTYQDALQGIREHHVLFKQALTSSASLVGKDCQANDPTFEGIVYTLQVSAQKAVSNVTSYIPKSSDSKRGEPLSEFFNRIYHTNVFVIMTCTEVARSIQSIWGAVVKLKEKAIADEEKIASLEQPSATYVPATQSDQAVESRVSELKKMNKALKKSIKDLESRVNALTEEADLKKKSDEALAKARTENAALGSQVTTMKSEIERLRAALTHAQERNKANHEKDVTIKALQEQLARMQERQEQPSVSSQGLNQNYERLARSVQSLYEKLGAYEQRCDWVMQYARALQTYLYDPCTVNENWVNFRFNCLLSILRPDVFFAPVSRVYSENAPGAGKPRSYAQVASSVGLSAGSEFARSEPASNFRQK